MVETKTLAWTPAEELRVREDIGRLYGYLSSREAKYQRNLNRYHNNGRGARTSIWDLYGPVQGYQPVFYIQAGTQTILNTLKSCIDTIVSKISQAKVRPFFNPVRGDYQTIKACRAAQDFFDAFYEEQEVYQQGPEALRNALAFDMGVIFLDSETVEIRSIPPWCYFVDPGEWSVSRGRRLTRCMIHEKHYPCTALFERYPEAKEKLRQIQEPRTHAGEFTHYFDLAEGRRYFAYDQTVFRCTEITYKRPPVVLIHWTKPVKGFMTTGLIDDLYTIQVQIDELQVRIDDATRSGFFNTVFTPKGSEIKETMLSNKAALAVEYTPGPEGGIPVVSTPPALNDQWLELLNGYIQRAYEIAGISQLSAQAKKPAGLNSGVALDTYEDIESERHNVTLQSYIRMLVEIAKVAIEVFPAGAEVLPRTISRASVNWADIKKQRDAYTIQFSAGSALAKDPAKKLEQINQLVAMNIIPKAMVAQLLEIPDLEGVYSVVTASYDYCQAVIERCAETGAIDFMPVVDLQMLFTETIRWMLRLAADEANKKYLLNLKRLLEAIDAVRTAAPPPEPPAPPAPPEPGPAGAGPDVAAPPIPAPVAPALAPVGAA